MSAQHVARLYRSLRRCLWHMEALILTEVARHAQAALEGAAGRVFVPLLASEVGLQLAHDAWRQHHRGQVNSPMQTRRAVPSSILAQRNRCPGMQDWRETLSHTRRNLWEDGTQGRRNPSKVRNDLQLAPRHVVQRLHLHNMHVGFKGNLARELRQRADLASMHAGPAQLSTGSLQDHHCAHVPCACELACWQPGRS